MITLTVIALVVMFASGTHLGVAMGLIAAVLLMTAHGIPLAVLGQVAFKSVNSYSLVAIPFFILAGDIMTRGNIAGIVFSLVANLMRVLRGGMALTAMTSCVFFAAITGSSSAAAAAIGSATIDALGRQNYPQRFAAGLAAVGGTLGLMIPPSLSFILIGVLANLPIDQLFIAGILPGLFEGALLGIVAVVISARRGYGEPAQPPDVGAFLQQLPRALPALMMPVLIIGSIYSGILTPTEVSAMAVVYGVILCLFVYSTADLRALWEAARQTTSTTAMAYLVVIGGSLLSFMLTRLGAGTMLAEYMSSLGLTAVSFLLVVNVLLLFLGMFLDGMAMTVLVTPILFPMAAQFGINPIHLAVIITANCEIATLTPPVGFNLFIMSAIARVPLEEVVRGVAPFYLTRLAALMVITYVPALSLALL